MIPKAEFLTWIDDYLMDELSASEKRKFEIELQQNPDLQDELIFQQEIQSAISENDVIELKKKLDVAAKINKTYNVNDSFELLDNFADIDELTDSVSTEELINFYDSLPKAHVYQHDLVSNENITEFYKEQNLDEFIDDEIDSFDNEDFSEFAGLEEAILEKDILNLRETLSQVAKSVQANFSAEDIDKYVNGELYGEQLELFENELKVNQALRKEVEMVVEINEAIQETDIQSLRAQLTNLMETETSWKVSEENLNAFFDGMLEGEELDEFNEELSYNTDLMAEVNFQNELSEAILEKDVMNLREKMGIARQQLDKTEMRTLIPEGKSKLLKPVRYVAAVAVVIFIVSGVLNYVFSPASDLYTDYHVTYKGSVERAVTDNSDEALNESNYYFVNGESDKALSVLLNAEKTAKEKFVYNYKIASIYQEKQEFWKAINNYDKVITHGDNLYVEEAEWKKGLCLVKLGEKQLARTQLEAVLNRNGFYKKDAKTILTKLKYSVK